MIQTIILITNGLFELLWAFAVLYVAYKEKNKLATIMGGLFLYFALCMFLIAGGLIACGS